MIKLEGPSGSPFEGGVFRLDFQFENYPFKAPKVIFLTQIYHPNIDDKGEICQNVYEKDWAPENNLYDSPLLHILIFYSFQNNFLYITLYRIVAHYKSN